MKYELKGFRKVEELRGWDFKRDAIERFESLKDVQGCYSPHSQDYFGVPGARYISADGKRTVLLFKLKTGTEALILNTDQPANRLEADIPQWVYRGALSTIWTSRKQWKLVTPKVWVASETLYSYAYPWTYSHLGSSTVVASAAVVFHVKGDLSFIRKVLQDTAVYTSKVLAAIAEDDRKFEEETRLAAAWKNPYLAGPSVRELGARALAEARQPYGRFSGKTVRVVSERQAVSEDGIFGTVNFRMPCAYDFVADNRSSREGGPSMKVIDRRIARAKGKVDLRKQVTEGLELLRMSKSDDEFEAMLQEQSWEEEDSTWLFREYEKTTRMYGSYYGRTFAEWLAWRDEEPIDDPDLDDRDSGSGDWYDPNWDDYLTEDDRIF